MHHWLITGFNAGTLTGLRRLDGQNCYISYESYLSMFFQFYSELGLIYVYCFYFIEQLSVIRSQVFAFPFMDLRFPVNNDYNHSTISKKSMKPIIFA